MKIHSPTGCRPPGKQRCFTRKRQPKSVVQIRDSYEPKIIWPIQIWTKSPRIWVVSRVVNNLARHEASKRFFCNTSNGLISHEWGLQRTKMALMKLDETIESWSGSRYARLEVMQADVQKSTQMQHQLQRGDEHVNFMWVPSFLFAFCCCLLWMDSCLMPAGFFLR